MGLFGSIGDAVGDAGSWVVGGTGDAASYVVGGAGDVAEGTADFVGADGIGDAVDGAADGAADAVDGAADGAAGAVDDVAEGAGDVVDDAAGAVGDIVESGADLIVGSVGDIVGTAGGFVAGVVSSLLGFAGDGLQAAADAFGWLRDNVGVIPVDEITDVLETLFGLLAGFFEFLIDIFDGVSDFFDLLEIATPTQQFALMLGMILIFLSFAYVYLEIQSGQVIVLPGTTRTLFIGFMIFWFGFLMFIWAGDKTVGSVTLAGSGVTLAALGEGGDESLYLTAGFVMLLIGIPLSTKTLNFPDSVTVLAFGGIVGAILGLDQLRELI